jgi:cytoskeletal protein CcmA (bactofilin family)
MFSDKKTRPNSNNSNQMAERNIIGSNTKFVGDIISDGDFRIDGTIEGTIKTTARIIIGKNGTVNGEMACSNADIEGTVNGKLTVDELLTLKQSANIQGEVTMDKLSVEPGAVFNVTCAMKNAVKALNQNAAKKAEKTA